MLTPTDKSILEILLSDKLVSKEELSEAAKKPAMTKTELEFLFATNCGESLIGLGALMLKKNKSKHSSNPKKLTKIDALFPCLIATGTPENHMMIKKMPNLVILLLVKNSS